MSSTSYELLVHPINCKLFCVLLMYSNPTMPAALQVDQVKAFHETNLMLFLLSLKSSRSGVSFKVNSWSLCLFSANATQIKKRTSKIKLFCSKWRNQLNVRAVRSANQEQVFLALDQSGASNFALFRSKIKKEMPSLLTNQHSETLPVLLKKRIVINS